MIRRDLPFYRSEITRWVFIATGLFLTFSLSPWGPPEWRDTPSLRWLHQLLPWPVLCAGFAAYTLLLIVGTPRVCEIADWLGLFMYGCGLVALFVTIRGDRPNNPFAIAAMVLACVLHFAAARLASFQDAKDRQ